MAWRSNGRPEDETCERNEKTSSINSRSSLSCIRGDLVSLYQFNYQSHENPKQYIFGNTME